MGIAVLVITSAAACYVLWKFWERQINVISRPKSLLAALLLLIVSLAPAVGLFDGFTSGVIRCLSKVCEQTYPVDEKPLFFWVTMSILYAIFLGLFVASAYVFYRFARPGRST